MSSFFGLILLGFGVGVVAVFAIEAVGVLWIMKRLRHKLHTEQSNLSSQTQLDTSSKHLDHQQSLYFSFNKQGVVWVLESGQISKEPKRKEELLEVSPIKMYGQIKGQSLILRESDGLHKTVELKGCTVQAVSASILSSKKWEKKFPIKVESKTSVIYNGSKTLYVYLETSWEKEAWCKALFLASCDEEEKVKWFTQLHEDFHNYLTSLNSVYQCLMKPSVGLSVEGAIERDIKPDDPSSKVRQFLKKIAKKTSRVGLENKSNWSSLSGNEGKKNTENLCASQDDVLAPLPSKLPHLGSQNIHSVSSDGDVEKKFGIDEGTLCWNLLISRLFFDVKGSMQLKRAMQERIQRTLSNMRTSSYIGEIICTDINTGNVPPCIVGLRALPMEMSEVWALEVDIEYSGGAVLEIETRLEARELELHAGTDDSNSEPSNVEAVQSDLPKGFECLGKELKLEERENDCQEQKEDDASKSFKSTMSSTNHGSRWKSLLNSLAKQVSQVPLSLAIRVVSLKGTLRLHIKPPPSDQLWYGFTSMPDIDFNLESSVGEQKITSGYFALLVVNRLKKAILENLVLPNCENLSIPWMLAEKDDWVPPNVAPFIWINQEFRNEISTSVDTNNQSSGGEKATSEASANTSSNVPTNKPKNPKSIESCQEPTSKSSDSLALPSFSGSLTLERSSSLEELTMPLLENEKSQETRDFKEPSLQNVNQLETSENKVENNSEFPSLHRSLVVMEKQNHIFEQEDELPKKMGRKERMFDLGKKMGEKLEEKRRHLEEKSRHIVEKMRGP
ncbi:uncharacterized protein [Cicer arietinum]|uniref:Testis-expressed protein 2-like isoform X2 n=1 Tax=Cicer arietinum TaxID=3827 RepID=A0A1S2XW67_CICAR|nr:testis-expressed protein 2-like isoform X2 [Cicer arietinum]